MLTSLTRRVGLPPIDKELAEHDLPFATRDATSIPVLIRLTYDKDWNVRWYALLRLRRLGAMQKLLKRLRDAF